MAAGQLYRTSYYPMSDSPGGDYRVSQDVGMLGKLLSSNLRLRRLRYRRLGVVFVWSSYYWFAWFRLVVWLGIVKCFECDLCHMDYLRKWLDTVMSCM